MLALAASTSAALSNAELYQRVALEKERSFAILANIADGIVAVDREGEVVLWNAGGGADHRRRRRRTRSAARPPSVLQRTLESGSDAPIGDRLVSIMRGREEVWLSVTEAVMRDPAGAVAGRIFAFRDISADRLVEQMKSDFVSTVSHELRTPLTSIYGFAETLLRQDVLFGEEERQHVPRLHRLRVAAPDGDRRRAAERRAARHRRPAGQPRADRRARRRRRGRAERAGRRRLERPPASCVDLPDEPLPANADRDKLRQVFSILLDNAVKYSPEGGTVTVGVEPQARHGRGQRRGRGDRHPAGRPGADLPQVLPRRRRRAARRRRRHRARALHRARARDGDGRAGSGSSRARARARRSRSSCPLARGVTEQVRLRDMDGDDR